MKVQLDEKEIDRLTDEFEKRTRRRPTHVSELVQAGLLREVPRDPAGYPYVLGADGKVDLNSESPMREKEAEKQ
jgi:hypothetical protein